MGNHRTRRLSRGAQTNTAGDGDDDSGDRGDQKSEEPEVTSPESDGNTKNTLLLTVGHHGKTKKLSFNLPNQVSSKATKKLGNDVNVIIRVPQLELGLLDEVYTI